MVPNAAAPGRASGLARAGQPEVEPDPPPRSPDPAVARPGRRHRRLGQPRRHPRPAQLDLLDGQRLPEMAPRRRRHPVGRPDHPPRQPPQPRPSPPGPVAPGPRRRRLHPPGQGGEQGDQTLSVEGGVVAGDGDPQAPGPGDDPQRGLGGQVERADQAGGVQRVAVDDQRLQRRSRMPGLPAQPGPGHRHRPVQGLEPCRERVGGRGQGGGGHHHPGGPPVGEPQQGQRVRRGGRRQPGPAVGHPSPRPIRRPR